MGRILISFCGLMIPLCMCPAQSLDFAFDRIRFTATADSLALPGPQGIGIGPIDADKLAFRFVGAVPADGPNFVVVSPPSGVTPGTGVLVALNPNVVPYLGSGSYVVTLQFAVPGQVCPSPSPGQIPCAAISVILDLHPQPPPTVSAVFSSATLQAAISPGELVSILGTHLSTAPITIQYDSAGLYPISIGTTPLTPNPGNTTVTFNGTPGALLYVSTTQINAQVPYEVAGQGTLNVVVKHNGQPSPAFTVPLFDTSPGIFTVDQNGNGQGAILNSLNNVVSQNSANNPAPKGSGIAIFATGSGLWNRTVQDGSIFLAPSAAGGAPALTAPVSLTIGGQPARILYAGAAPFLISGMLQVNAIVPDGIGSGAQPVILTIGENSNSQQQVTVAVQ